MDTEKMISKIMEERGLKQIEEMTTKENKTISLIQERKALQKALNHALFEVGFIIVICLLMAGISLNYFMKHDWLSGSLFFFIGIMQMVAAYVSKDKIKMLREEIEIISKDIRKEAQKWIGYGNYVLLF